jgi:ubiquinone/menaquinone biosynthesis C-methylase UbiE
LNKLLVQQKSNSHFSKIASKYKDLRTTDVDHIQYIVNQLSKKSKISMADIGCGDGRYSVELLKCLRNDSYLHCIDFNENMIKHLKPYLMEQGINNFCAAPGDASKLPLESESMDYIVTFNAIHHFDIQKFLTEVYECLKDDGRAFLYTRLRNQNSRNIWGQHFPLFSEMEDRLYEFEELQYAIKKADMKIIHTNVFGHNRTSNMADLINKAKNHHYSTFDLYSGSEFEKSLGMFKKNLIDHFDDLENIQWQDENILIEISK